MKQFFYVFLSLIAGLQSVSVVNNSVFCYNTQDALDAGHIDTGGPYKLSITNSQACGNGGATARSVQISGARNSFAAR